MGTNKTSLADTLFSKVRQRILGLLYNHPEKDFYTNEIIRIVNAGRGSVQRELDKLTTAGLIHVKKNGESKTLSSESILAIVFGTKNYYH